MSSRVTTGGAPPGPVHRIAAIGLGARHAGRGLEHVERRPGVTGADGHEVLPCLGRQLHRRRPAHAASASARSTSQPSSSSDSGSRRNTRSRDSSAELTEK